ncbi:A-kinase anchor protein 13 isoform X3 [Mugil cephalus]|uniref:A-kinase anchor protein 13 isoform X3 n=1 Tax=Mugil cephalus TaxID=48193 RepID=UPI001FB80670|nr:A-kinase anchor protein 13 isoform X3 [Mugil cephalus]
MKLNPQQAPLYGHCVISVQLADEELPADEEGVDYFLLFAGSTQRHLTSTLRSSHDILQVLCPAHDCCEVVLVTLCSVTRGVAGDPEDTKPRPCRVAPLAEHRFSFVQDLAFDMAQFLVSTAGRTDGLDGALLLDECQIPLQECERLDESLALALHHLVLPPGWSLLGNKLTNSTDLNPQETLLHFSVRRGLIRVTRFLLQQPGAREALRLANRQGYTPSTVAELRGHKCLHELLTKAEADAETDRGTEAVQQVSADARVFCHLPRLNTHSLTLSILPGRDTPTLQESVEQLLHLISHLHAKGVSVLELPFDSLHTASECREGVQAELTCLERLHQTATATEFLDITAEGSVEEDCAVESGSTVECGHDETGNTENDSSLSVSTPALEVRPQEHGLGPPEDWACLISNSETNYCQTEEGVKEQLVSTQSLCGRSEEAQRETEGKGVTVGILPPVGCGKQAEETDRGEVVVREGQEAKKGEDRSAQEAEDSTAGRREVEEEQTNSESTDLIAASGDENALLMGQSPSSDCSEVSDSSDSEMKECSLKGEKVQEVEPELCQDFCDGLSSDKEKVECEELTDLVSTPRDLPSPVLIVSSDVIAEPESAVPLLLIEGLHEGEPPPDINSKEQNQETAGKDYATEEQRGLVSETGCHSGNCTGTVSVEELGSEHVDEASGHGIESTGLPMEEPDNIVDLETTGNSIEDTRTELLDFELPPEKMPTKGHADSMVRGISSDDDSSFRSVGSSTTDIFHPTEDSSSVVDQDFLQTNISELSSGENQIEDQHDHKHNESNGHSLNMDTELPLEPGTGSVTVTDCTQDGTDSQSQLSTGFQTKEALDQEVVEEAAPELSKQDLSLDPVLSESKDNPTVEVDGSECGETNSSDMNVGTGHCTSELASGVPLEPGPSGAEENNVIGPVEERLQLTETSDKCVAEAAVEESENVQLTVQQSKQDNSEMALDDDQITENLTTEDKTVENQSTEDQITVKQTTEDKTVENQSTEGQRTEDRTIENQSTEGQSTEDQTIENQSTEDQIIENQTTEDKTIESQSTEDKIIENQTTEDKTIESQSTEDKIIEDKTNENQNTEDHSTEDHSTEDQSTEDKIIEAHSTEDQGTEDHSAEDQITENQTTEDKTIESQSTEDQITENQTTEDKTIENQSTENQTTEDKTIEGHNTGDQSTENQTADVIELSNTADANTQEVDPPASNSEPPTEAHTENQMTHDTVDGFLGSCSSPIQEEDVIKSEDTLSDAGEEENGSTEGTGASTIHRDREASFPQPCNTHHSGSSPSSVFPSRTSSATSCPSSTHRDSGSDIESLLNAEPGYESVFRKNDEPVTGGDSASEVSVSCSSTDDTASVGPSSSSPEGSQGLSCSWSPEEGIQTGVAVAGGLDSGGGGGGAGEAEEEAKDRVTEVPLRSCILRSSLRSLSPPRRHSWGPGKNYGGDTEMNQRSSIRSPGEGKPAFHRRSYSLEGLSGVQEELRGPITRGPRIVEPSRMPRQDSDDRGSLVSLTEEQEERGECGRQHDPKSRRYRPLRHSCPPMTLPLTKSVSMLAISQRDIDGLRSYSSPSGSLAYSISEEEPGPLRSDTEGKGTTKVSRTFSYLKNKMYKKNREKEREKKDKDKDGKEKDKKTVNGHLFTSVSSNHAAQCSQCNKAFNNKETFYCTYCNASVHKGCRDSLPVCAKVKMKLPKQQCTVPDSSSIPAVTMRNKSGGTRERPWSAILSPEDHSSMAMPAPRRHTSIMGFHGNNLSKSLSISNIAGPVFDEIPIKGLRYLSQSTDSLNRTNPVTESMESLTDEGTEMMDGQLMGEFEADAKELEADSWSLGVEQQYLQQLDRELVKRQDVIYELMQTEMHHIRTLRIMSEVYSKGLHKEVQLELQTLEKLFPALDELLDFHTQHLLRLLERKKESQQEGGCFEGSFLISRIGDVLVSQFSGSNGESMKRVYGRFCSRHNEAVNLYKDLLTKDKRFKAFIKKKMSSSIVRRLSIPECILLVTQRITKYPVLIQRMLQHTKESEDDFYDLTDAVRLVKDVIAAVDSKVNEHEKRRRLKEFHSRMDSKSIMMRKSGQIFAREDLLRRRLIHDGALQLKNVQGRLKDVHILLLSDVIVFLQEKDQKYVFAMLDQRSTVISLQKLIVREVANEERGLFLITAGIEKPEMMEVLASSKEERNTWMQLIQDAMQSMEKDEDEGIPSETEDDKRQLEIKAKEMRDMLKQKDKEIMSLLEEKVRLFRGMWEGLSPGEEACRQVEPFFRSASGPEPPRGASIMKDALEEVETLQTLVNGSLGGAMASVQEGGGAGPVCLPRRAETFGGFDSHQMHSSKSGDRDESEDMSGDLRRTESDSVLKKQVLHSVSNLHLLLSSLQAVVVQQDSYIDDQRQTLSERSSSCTSLSRQSSRPSSLIEQEKQRSLEKQRQELASLQRQQAAHAEEKRRREKEWDLREQHLSEREALVHVQAEEILKQHKALEEEKQELQSKKEVYQKELERLRDAQRKLQRDKEAVQRQLEKLEELRAAERTPSTTSDESQFPGSSQSLELDPLELSPSSSSSSLPRLQPPRSKAKGKGLNPFTSSSTNLKGGEANNQVSKGLLQLTKNKSKDGKEKKKKKGKGGSAQAAGRKWMDLVRVSGLQPFQFDCVVSRLPFVLKVAVHSG